MSKTGRPAAGLREGERVKDYPQMSFRIPPEARQKLIALSKLQRQPQWRIVLDALECYMRERPNG